ncbi:hypothetical protein MUN77_08375 [Leucobacter allii]|uniref:hypothetical protein n=1 Tax=Leucobacter allii TaxID=2932247 RepID=UPI001FD356F1|nr:hypothetical protein [Leucobacter allii]UOR03283.1 hypothetical protein MUN77_08375 [Leucobacter allii]
MQRRSPYPRVRSAWPGAIASETLKLLSLRSNRILLVVALVMIAGAGTLLSIATVGRLSDERFAGQEISATPEMFVDAVLWAQIVIVVLAVLAVVNEYTSGQVTLSLLAAPTRLPWLGAKALVLALSGFLVGVIGTAVSFGVSALVVVGTEVRYEIAFGDAALLSMKSGLYLAVIAVLAIGVAALVRHVVAALVAVLALIVVLPPVLASIPGIGAAADFLPTIAGRRLISDFETAVQLSPWAGFGVLAAWTALALALSGALLAARDA